MNKQFSIDDFCAIKQVVRFSNNFLLEQIKTSELIKALDYFSSELLRHKDPDLLIFKAILSDIDEIKDEIKTGRNFIGPVNTTKKDLEEYIESNTQLIKDCCQKLIERYTPILKELKEKYPEEE